MKRITLLMLFTFLSGVAMQSQNLLTNGDFEEGMVVWEGNAFNVIEEGGNSFNFANVETAGEPFAVNLSQRGLDITQGETYVLTFDASSDGNRTMLAGIGLFVDPFTNVNQSVDLTTETTTYELSLEANFVSTDGRVLFDMGADTGVVVIDNVTLVLGEPAEETLPEVAAPTPPERDPATVFSLFSDAYTVVPNTVFGAFGVGTQDITTIQIEGDNTQQISLNQPASEFLLVDWGLPVDNSALTHFHMDYWIDTNLSTGLIANPKWSNHVGDAGETSAFQLTNPVGTFGEWVSIDVPLTAFVDGDATQQRDALRQFVLTLAGAETGTRTIFIDNLYLHNDTTLSTDEFSAIEVTAVPNPTTNRWTITTDSQISNIDVYDVLGKKVLSIAPNAASINLDATALTSGLYIARVTTVQGTQSLKLLKQ